MGDVVNLRRFRKAKIRADGDAQAAVNRAAFGRSKADRSAAAQVDARTERLLDGHRLDSRDDPSTPET